LAVYCSPLPAGYPADHFGLHAETAKGPGSNEGQQLPNLVAVIQVRLKAIGAAERNGAGLRARGVGFGHVRIC